VSPSILQEKARQAELGQLMGFIHANAEQGVQEHHKSALKPLWDKISDKCVAEFLFARALRREHNPSG
jgi:hypothetical protein